MPAVHFWGAGQYGCSTEEKKKALEKLNVFKGFLAHLPGFEPGTFRLGGGRSILLSYKCIVFQGSLRSLNITIIPGWRRDVNLK